MNAPVPTSVSEGELAGAARWQRLARMKLLATGLLVAMTCLYIGARVCEPRVPWLSFVAAMAEAAMIGALADWFAVVALFRHPLGIPVPHTNIIARGKDNLATGLADFVVDNFITRELVGRQLRDLDLAGHAATWLDDNRDAVAVKAAGFIPTVIDTLDDEDVRRFLHGQLLDRLRKVDVAPLAGKIIEILTSGGKHHAMLDDILDALATYLKEPGANERLKQLVRDKLGFILRKVDDYVFSVSGQIVDALAELLLDIRDSKQHEMRRKFDEALARLVDDLKNSPKYRARGEALKQDLFSHRSIAEYVATLWRELKEYIVADAGREQSVLVHAMANAVHQFAGAIRADKDFCEKLNGWLRGGIAQFADAHKNRVGRMITDKVSQWDGASLSARLELQVGSDLQFIRINGTIIGGLVGLLIHVVTRLMVQ